MDILEKIAVNKRLEVAELKINLPLDKLMERLPKRDEKSFAKALMPDGQVHIVAEIKKASPSKGVLTDDFDAKRLAEMYHNGGARALSILTEQKYFQGRYEYLKIAKEVTGLPVLCKDFILEPYQVYHALYCGADAILLIVKLLKPSVLSELIALADEVSLDALVEVHDESELGKALHSGARIVGVNNRNLRDFSVDINTSIRLSNLIPNGIIKVAESGIFTSADVSVLREAGYDNFLIGEALVKAGNPVELMKKLRGI